MAGFLLGVATDFILSSPPTADAVPALPSVGSSGRLQWPAATMPVDTDWRGRTSMRRRTSWIAAAAVAVAAIGGGTGIAAATGRVDHDQPITGAALSRASAAAIAHAGGGRVTGSEVGDEEGYYEVEITLSDGRQVDVHLGHDFNVLTTKPDRDAGRDQS
jgi:hypothetical protein